MRYPTHQEQRRIDAIMCLLKAEGISPLESEKVHESLKNTVAPVSNIQVYNRWLIAATVKDME